MDKFEFIESVLKNHKLTSSQREKIIQLASKELKSDIEVILGMNSKIQTIENKQDNNKELLRVKLNSNFQRIIKALKKESGLNLQLKSKVIQMENELKDIRTKKTTENKTTSSNRIITHHQPQSTIEFLNSLSKDENFKWFTHNPENAQMHFNYEDYLKKAKADFSSQGNKNFYTYSNVRNFLFNTRDKENNKWPSFYENQPIKHTWTDVRGWCAKNPNKHPFDAIIDNISFSESINKFKHAIEFRIDEKDKTFFRKTKKFIRDNLPQEFNINYTDAFTNYSKSLNTYIDINMFFRGLKQILVWIELNKAKSENVLIDLQSEDEVYKFQITHLNSYISISPDSPKVLGCQGDLHKIRLWLFSVLDWEIISDFKYEDEKKTYKITCLNTDTTLENGKILSKNLVSQEKESIGGLKHILKIYKTSLE